MSQVTYKSISITPVQITASIKLAEKLLNKTCKCEFPSRHFVAVLYNLIVKWLKAVACFVEGTLGSELPWDQLGLIKWCLNAAHFLPYPSALFAFHLSFNSIQNFSQVILHSKVKEEKAGEEVCPRRRLGWRMGKTNPGATVHFACEKKCKHWSVLLIRNYLDWYTLDLNTINVNTKLFYGLQQLLSWALLPWN